MNRLFSKLLLTGAAGTLGRVLAPSLQGLAHQLRVSDLAAALRLKIDQVGCCARRALTFICPRLQTRSCVHSYRHIHLPSPADPLLCVQLSAHASLL